MIGTQVTFSVSAGVSLNGEFSFISTRDSSQSKLQITKEETRELTYKLAIIYLGLGRDRRPEWRFEINDSAVWTENGQELAYFGSTKFVFKPSSKDSIEIEETDEHETAKIWVDLSRKPYYLSYSSLVIDEKIQALIEKGKFFTALDGKVSRKLFFHNNVGVILYARDEKGNADIYLAKDGEFTKCDAKKTGQCRCEASDSTWEVKDKDEKVHVLKFPLGNVGMSGHGSEISWDKTRLKQIRL